MINHYHLIVEAELPELSRRMRILNGGYARIFNERHDRHGHLFGARYSAHVIDREDHLEKSCLYVLENPVRAGLCERPSKWRWSGCPALGRQFGPVSGTVPFRDSPSGLAH